MKMDGEKKKKMWKMKIKFLFHHFTLKISDLGNLFSIPWTAYFNKFLPNSVNHDQDWMPIKLNLNLMIKLHPNIRSLKYFVMIQHRCIYLVLKTILVYSSKPLWRHCLLSIHYGIVFCLKWICCLNISR